MGGGTLSIYCYGDTERLWPAVEAVLRARGVREGSVLLRRAGAGTTVELGASG